MLTHNVFTNTTFEEEKKPHGCSWVLVAVRMRLQASHRPIGPLFVFAAAANQAPEHTPEPHARPATLAGPQARYQLANSSPPPALAGCLGQTHRRRPLAAPNCTHSTDRGGGSTRGADKAGAAGQKPPSQGLGRKQGHGRPPGGPSAATAAACQVAWHHRRSRQHLMGMRVCLCKFRVCRHVGTLNEKCKLMSMTGWCSTRAHHGQVIMGKCVSMSLTELEDEQEV